MFMLRAGIPSAWALIGMSVPCGTCSAAMRAVRTLATLAGGRGWWGLPWSSTAPVSASTRIHALGGGGGGGVVVGPGGGGCCVRWRRCTANAFGARKRSRQASAVRQARNRRIATRLGGQVVRDEVNRAREPGQVV